MLQLLSLVALKFIRSPVFTLASCKEMPPVLVLPYTTLSFAFFAPLREAKAFPLARSLHSLKSQRYRDTKIAKESWFSLSACSVPSAVKASASKGKESGGIACATHSNDKKPLLSLIRSIAELLSNTVPFSLLLPSDVPHCRIHPLGNERLGHEAECVIGHGSVLHKRVRSEIE